MQRILASVLAITHTNAFHLDGFLLCRSSSNGSVDLTGRTSLDIAITFIFLSERNNRIICSFMTSEFVRNSRIICRKNALKLLDQVGQASRVNFEKIHWNNLIGSE